MDFKKRYQFDPQKDLLGKGGFSKVYKAYDAVRKREVALKFFYGHWTEKYDVIGEINRMEDLVHPNLIRYYDADIIENVNAIGEREEIQVGILEYANSGDITSLFANKPKELIHSVIKDVVEGLEFLHKHSIAHRDLKPTNILLSEKEGKVRAKIADFGISKNVGFADQSVSTQLLGSVEYMAPEQFNPTKYGIDKKVGTNLDLWALGIIIYELFTQKTPFGNRSTGLSNEEILSNILFKNIVIEYDRLEEPYQTIVRRCLVKHAGERVKNASELLDILENRISVQFVKEQEVIDVNPTQVLVRPSLDASEEARRKEAAKKQEAERRLKEEQLLEQKRALEVQRLKEQRLEAARNKTEAESLAETQRIEEARRRAAANQNKVRSNTGQVTPPVNPATSQTSSNLGSGDTAPIGPKKEVYRKIIRKERINEPNSRPSSLNKEDAALLNRSKVNFSNPEAQKAIVLGKRYFQEKNYTQSYNYLGKVSNALEFDTEAKFYLGFMLYNGKCGGAQDDYLGRKFMDEAKQENRTLVSQLMLKYVLGTG